MSNSEQKIARAEPDSNTDNQSEPTKDGIQLELLIAICAVLISVASFYATFLQANAAEKQVTAMTLPLISFITGNVNMEDRSSEINYTLANKGVGPAKIETFLLSYKNKYYYSRKDYFDACCKAEFEAFKNRNVQLNQASLITSDPQLQFLPSGEEINYLRLAKHPDNEAFWQSLNEARRETKVTVCYCSLLDNCYWLTGNNQISETPSCRS